MDEIERCIQGVIVFVILGVGFFGNAIVSFAILVNRDMRSRTYLLLLNLTIANMGMIGCCVPFTLVTLLKARWIFSSTACQINGFMNLFWLATCILSVALIVLYKFVSIRNPFKVSGHRRRHVFLVVTLVWLLSFACAIGPTVGWNEFVYEESAFQCSLNPPDSVSALTYGVFFLILVFVMPTATIVSFALSMCVSVRRHVRRVQASARRNQPKVSGQRRFVTTIGVLVSMYILSWTPFFVYSILYLLEKTGKDYIVFLNVAYIVAYAGSSTMPLVLCYRHSRLKKAVRGILFNVYCCCGMKDNNRRHGLSLSTSSSVFSHISTSNYPLYDAKKVSDYADRKNKLGDIRDPSVLDFVDWLETYM